MKNIALFIALLLAPLAAFAADAGNLANEIIYRANLGRAADVTLLIDQGASPNQQDSNGVPVLTLAAARKDEEGINVVKALLAGGADINAKNKEGQSALFAAARQGNRDTVKYLLEQGIRYYDTDNTGNIARNVAYSSGHKDITEMMDAFVKEHAQKIDRQYKEYNDAVQKQNEALEAEQKRQQEAALKAAQDVRDAEEAQAKNAEAKRQTPAFDQTMQRLAMESCTFQYWSFCQLVNQTSDLSADEMAATIASHKGQVIELLKSATEDYRMSVKESNDVSNAAKQRIANQLSAMPSGTYRFEHGVCKTKDAEERCGKIAISWSQKAPPMVQSASPSNAAESGYKGKQRRQGGVAPLGQKQSENPSAKNHTRAKTRDSNAVRSQAKSSSVGTIEEQKQQQNQQFDQIYQENFPQPQQQR